MGRDSPSRVIVVGGTGAFGQHLVRGLLATTDVDVVVAARNLARAANLAATCNIGLPRRRVLAVQADVRSISSEALASLHAFAIVDAAGPFQSDGQFRLARAAIAAGLHYVDLADGRAHVAGFSEALDAAARQTGVVVLTGASSTPALSNAALDRLTAGWRQVDTVEIAIAPGNRGAPRGTSVIQAILSYVGKPVSVLLDGSWVYRRGWRMTVRRNLPGLGWRWLALCDTPDLDLVPARLAVRRTMLFRAGLELSALHLGLLVLSLPVQLLPRGWTLQPLAAVVRALADLLRNRGTNRGGMVVEVSGLDSDGLPVQGSWSLLASGDGAVIPVLPALAALRALLLGHAIAPGARACVGVLTLAAIEAEFTRYRISTQVDIRSLPDQPEPLFARVLGAARFAALPQPIRAIHTPQPWASWRGQALGAGAQSWLGRLLTRLLGLPKPGTEVPVRVDIERRGNGERWTRRFGTTGFQSTLRSLARSHAAMPGIEERIGPIIFGMAIDANEYGIALTATEWRVGRIPLPADWCPQVSAREWVSAEGRFNFDVSAALPLMGQVVRYAGWLEAPVPSEPVRG